MSLTNTIKHDGDLWRTPEVVRNGVLSLLKPNETIGNDVEQIESPIYSDGYCWKIGR